MSLGLELVRIASSNHQRGGYKLILIMPVLLVAGIWLLVMSYEMTKGCF